MSPDEFMQRFSDCDDIGLTRLRRSPRLDAWPRSQAFYVEIARGLFSGDGNSCQVRQRFVQILREMLYTDGRTLTALLWIADLASKMPDVYAANGVNALAGIACYLGCEEAPVISKNQLFGHFQKWLEDEHLANNARVCLSKCADE